MFLKSPWLLCGERIRREQGKWQQGRWYLRERRGDLDWGDGSGRFGMYQVIFLNYGRRVAHFCIPQAQRRKLSKTVSTVTPEIHSYPLVFKLKMRQVYQNILLKEKGTKQCVWYVGILWKKSVGICSFRTFLKGYRRNH